MNESKALRVLADRLDELESLKAFPTEISDPGEVTVNWAEGRDHDGYPALSAAISALVGQHWNALRSQVLKSKEGEVQAARNNVVGLVGGSSLDAEPGSQGGPDMGARRFG
jgi:hypothetical protein